MFHVHPIDSLELAELAPYRTLKRSVTHEALGIFVAEGDKVVRRLLESSFTVVSLLLPEKRLAEFEPLLRARREDIRVFTAANMAVLDTLVGFDLYQGVLAIGKIPSSLSLDDALARSAKPRLFAAVDALSNAENLGAVVRNCAAFNVQALIVGETSASPFLRRSVRNSMGTIFRLPVVETAHLAHSLRELRDHGVRCIAAHLQTGGRTISGADFTGDCCVVFGSEGHGISSGVLDACDDAVAIPMPPDIDSLNVGAAAAVFLYEVNRQRGKG